MENEKNKWKTQWTTTVVYIDGDSGEILTKKEYKENYITLKKIKYAQRSKYGTGGTKTIQHICQRNPQRRIKFSRP